MRCSSPRFSCVEIGLANPPIYEICLGNDRVLIIVEDGLDRGDGCREPVDLMAANRCDGVTLGVVSELHRRFDSEPTGSADPPRFGLRPCLPYDVGAAPLLFQDAARTGRRPCSCGRDGVA
jgi:hypothetical protein